MGYWKHRPAGLRAQLMAMEIDATRSHLQELKRSCFRAVKVPPVELSEEMDVSRNVTTTGLDGNCGPIIVRDGNISGRCVRYRIGRRAHVTLCRLWPCEWE